ncbi:MAG: DUF4203 domain-containing protein, partial [Anaerolineales bacterium]
FLEKGLYMIRILQVILALAMLFLGRKLFWVFVGSIGFITATELAASNLTAQPEWVIVLIGLAAGIFGALLAVFFQAGAIGFAGILGGGYLGLLLLRYLGISNQTAQTIAYIVGAVIGLILMILLFDYALIALSSLSGSLILIEAVGLSGWLFWILAVIITVVGISVQYRQLEPSQVSP